MYNRYIPQADGSFQKNRVPDAPAQVQQNQVEAGTTQISVANDAPSVGKQEQINSIPRKQQVQRGGNIQRNHYGSDNTSGSVSSFLKGLLPPNFDTEDLIVVLLLLLMSGNNSNDQNAALLTLGIYLFM